MSSKKHLGLAILLMLVITGLGGLVLVWPVYRETAWINGRVEELRSKSENHDQQAQMVVRLADELDEMTQRVNQGHREIPATPDIAGLMRVLSLQVDGTTVRDQTFTAGEVREAARGTELPTMVQPLTIEMEARFDSVFALIRAAESMGRLLRVASINIEALRGPTGDSGMAKARIVIEAVYEPGGGGG